MSDRSGGAGGTNRGRVAVSVPATSANLGPGFDCLGLALEVRSRFAAQLGRPGDPALVIEVDGPGATAISNGPANLVFRAFQAVFEQLGRTCPPVRLQIRNDIPIGRGLGSSAAAIVGGLCLGRATCGGGLGDEDLVTLATEIEGHPDNVAAAFYGGLTLAATSHDGRPQITRCGAVPGFTAVVAVPDFEFSTHVARGLLPAQVTMGDAVFNLGRAATLVAGLLNGDARAVRLGMEDRLHQPYRAKALPFLNDVIAAAARAGAVGAALSGAGPSVLALVPAGDAAWPTAVGQAMIDVFAAFGHAAVMLTSPISARGAVDEDI
ncbi:MAG: homoserine kinase [Bacillota bacterium]